MYLVCDHSRSSLYQIYQHTFFRRRIGGSDAWRSKRKRGHQQHDARADDAEKDSFLHNKPTTASPRGSVSPAYSPQINPNASIKLEHWCCLPLREPQQRYSLRAAAAILVQITVFPPIMAAAVRSISEFSSAPNRMMMADIHIQIINPIAAPSEP
jgi:hypothetical protein